MNIRTPKLAGTAKLNVAINAEKLYVA
jgi:hypothetical protein